MTAVLAKRDHLRELADQAADELEGASAQEVLAWTDEQFGPSWCVAASMADSLTAHLAAQVRPGVDVVFLDTGYHFAETIGTRDAIAAILPVNVRTIRPRQSVQAQEASFGQVLHQTNPDLCCALRKVIPLRNALAPYEAWVSGLRRDESPTRVHVRVVEWDERRSMVKINPIAAWTQQDVERYVADNDVLINPLLSDGYGSVGCRPCTRRLLPGEPARAGRWAGLSKTECGIHG